MLMLGSTPPDVPSVTVPERLKVGPEGPRIVIDERPTTFSYVAVISTSPAATPETTPEALTTASAAFDERHAEAVVTVCVVPFDSVATAPELRRAAYGRRGAGDGNGRDGCCGRRGRRRDAAAGARDRQEWDE